MANIPKRHHFLPKSYLDGFTRDGLVWLFDRELNEYRRQQPLNTAVIKNFYVFENKQGQKDYSLETFFSQIEGNAKSAIRDLEADAEISPDQRLNLAAFIALLMVRSPKFDKEANEIADKAAKHIVKHAVPTVEAAGELVKRHSEKSGGEKISAESMFKFIHDEQFKMELNRNTVIGLMLESVQNVSFEVAMMDWLVVHAHPKTSFITTDEPIGFIVPENFRQTGEPVLGLVSHKISKFVPLSQSVGIIIGKFGGGFGHIGFDREQVRELNQIVAIESDRYVIGRDEALVQSVVKQSKVDCARPGTHLVVEHIKHPTDPHRTFMITHRALAGDPKKPFEFDIETYDRMKKFPQHFSLEENQKVILDFENLLRQYQMTIPTGSPLEDASMAIFEMLEIRKNKAVHNNKVDCRDRWRQALFLSDIARKAVHVKEHPDFRNLLSHLKLLLEPGNFSQFSAIQVGASPKEKETNNKVFELYVATILFRILTSLRFDSPNKSRGENPDVIGEYKGTKWGFACKVLHSENPLTFRDRIREGIAQIEKSDVNHGIVIVNAKNLIPHNILWPAKCDKESGEWTYGAYPMSDAASIVIQTTFEKFLGVFYAATGGPSSFTKDFVGKKAIPLVLMFYSSVVGYSPRSGVVSPMIVKRMFGFGDPSNQPMPEAKEIGDRFNDYLHDMAE